MRLKCHSSVHSPAEWRPHAVGNMETAHAHACMLALTPSCVRCGAVRAPCLRTHIHADNVDVGGVLASFAGGAAEIGRRAGVAPSEVVGLQLSFDKLREEEEAAGKATWAVKKKVCGSCGHACMHAWRLLGLQPAR